jgi:hypothetical protein
MQIPVWRLYVSTSIRSIKQKSASILLIPMCLLRRNNVFHWCSASQGLPGLQGYDCESELVQAKYSAYSPTPLPVLPRAKDSRSEYSLYFFHSSITSSIIQAQTESTHNSKWLFLERQCSYTLKMLSVQRSR